MYLPETGDCLKVFTDNEVKNFDEYFKSIKKKLYLILSEEQYILTNWFISL